MIRLLNVSFSAGCAVLIVTVLRMFCRRVPKGYCYGIWLVVLFRFLCPVAIPSPLSLLPVNAEPLREGIVYEAAPEIESGVNWIDQAVNGVMGESLAVKDPANSVNPIQIWLAVAFGVWVAGVIAFAGYHVWRLILLRRHLAGAAPAGMGVKNAEGFCPASAGAAPAGAGEEKIWEAEGLGGAFVLGVICPRIYLPADLPEGSRRYILSHEQVHIRRRDYLVKLLGLTAVGIHWFNPLSWVWFRMMCRDMEMSCDEQVLKDLTKDEQKGYLRVLLEQAERESGLLFPAAFGKNPVYGRVQNILHYRKRGKVFRVLTAVILVVMVVGLATSPKSAAESVAIIGGADGPTSIFVAAKVGGGKEANERNLEKLRDSLKHNMCFADGYFYYEGESENGGFPVPLMRLAEDLETEEKVGELPGSLICVRDGGACLWMDWEEKRIMAGSVEELESPEANAYRYLEDGERGRTEECSMERMGDEWLRIVLVNLEDPSRQEEYLLQIPEEMREEYGRMLP